MTQRDHSKLRPYDLLQAKVGDVVLTPNLTARGEVIAVSLKEVAFLWENDHFNSHRLDKEHCLFQPPPSPGWARTRSTPATRCGSLMKITTDTAPAK